MTNCNLDNVKKLCFGKGFLERSCPSVMQHKQPKGTQSEIVKEIGTLFLCSSLPPNSYWSYHRLSLLMAIQASPLGQTAGYRSGESGSPFCAMDKFMFPTYQMHKVPSSQSDVVLVLLPVPLTGLWPLSSRFTLQYMRCPDGQNSFTHLSYSMSTVLSFLRGRPWGILREEGLLLLLAAAVGGRASVMLYPNHTPNHTPHPSASSQLQPGRLLKIEPIFQGSCEY